MVLRRITLLVAVLTIASTAFSQITIHDTDVAPIGSSFTSGSTNSSATFNVGSGGANQSWTFGTFTWESASQLQVVNPANTPHGASFPTANRASFSPGTGSLNPDVYSYERLTSSSYTLLGMAIGDSLVNLDQAAVVISLPVTYQSTWTSVVTFHVDILPGYRITTTDSSIHTMDAWGTVNTPYGNYPCLRDFSHIWNITSITGLPGQTTENLEYSWVDQQGMSVVSVQSGDGVLNPNFTTGSLTMLGVPLAAEPVRGPVAERFSVGQNYPNPFNPNTILPVDIQKNARVSVDIYDETGRLVSSQNYDLPAGQHNLSVDGSRWSSGTYFARVSDGVNAQTAKMMLVK